MKWTGLGAAACAAILTVACSGDARDDRGNDADRTVGTSGVSNDDSAAIERDDDAEGRARIGAAVDDDQTRTRGSAETTHGATGDARHFAEQAAYAGNAEVKLGQLASERAQNPAVKEFAQMMVRDHSKSGAELKQAVSRHDVQPPAGLDAEHQRLYDRLSKLQGAEFDREYMNAMVEGHEKVKSMVSSRAGNNRASTDRTRGATGTSGTTGSTQLDTAVNQWATKTLPAIEQHLQKAEQVRAKVDGNTRGTSAMPKSTTGTSGAGKSDHQGDKH
jgi:putative membrane protein